MVPLNNMLTSIILDSVNDSSSECCHRSFTSLELSHLTQPKYNVKNYFISTDDLFKCPSSILVGLQNVHSIDIVFHNGS